MASQKTLILVMALVLLVLGASSARETLSPKKCSTSKDCKHIKCPKKPGPALCLAGVCSCLPTCKTDEDCVKLCPDECTEFACLIDGSCACIGCHF